MMAAGKKLVSLMADWRGYAAAAAAGALLVGGAAWTAQGWRYRAEIADIERDYAKARDDQAQATVVAIEAARTEERRRTQAVEKQRNDAQKMAAAAAGDAARARAERRGLLERVDALASSAAGRDPALTDGSPAGADAVDLLAYMLGRVSERAGEIAEIADRARVAGLTCERTYDDVRAKVP
ncbi:DUF2514 family protein [Achromobacter mucicolens]|jgi:hypothetical protein|uniref:DUF2514 family protein n=1 Tax=Achromobacter mucicolens TaxID=1389922 RepID=UPI00242BE1BE|nr:DUF2514 family protein [Achromobacter mucicolens]